MEPNQVIEALEQLNRESFDQFETKEMELAREAIRLKSKLSEGIFWYPISRYRRKRALSKIPAISHLENWPEDRWRSLMHEGDPRKRVVIYTCITGSYDRSQKPLYFPDHCDYILFSDKAGLNDAAGWKECAIPDNIKSIGNDAMINRYIKMHPFELFPKEYDYSIYIDGNIRPITDLSVLCELVNENVGVAFHRHSSRESIYDEIQACQILKKGNIEKLKEQAMRYKAEGFPFGFGMVECNVIVTDLRSLEAKNVLDWWWKEYYDSGSGRDQISLPYVLWKMGHTIDEVATLGNNSTKNPKIQFCGHV